MCFKNSRRDTFANFFCNIYLDEPCTALPNAFLANSTLAIFYHVKQGAPWRARHVVCKSNFSFRQKRSGKKWQGGHFLPPFRPSPIRLIPPAAVLKGLHGGVGCLASVLCTYTKCKKINDNFIFLQAKNKNMVYNT